eukprot:gene6506-7250_t
MASGNVKIVASDSQFQPELTNAGGKLVVVDFHATWCGPCRHIAPVFVQLSTKYPQAVFLKVDVDQCKMTAEKYGITAMPTFLFMKSKVKIDELQGADPQGLEVKIKKHIGTSNDDDNDDLGVAGHTDLNSFINKQGCTCLNESDDHTYENALKNGPGYLESDCDEQLLWMITFTQAVKLHSLKISAPDDGRAPKEIKIFKNQPTAMDFDQAERMVPLESLDLSGEDISGEKIIPLKYVKYQNVQNIAFFMKNNQGATETTVVEHFTIIGSPLESTNMNEFKRVAGEAGESH